MTCDSLWGKLQRSGAQASQVTNKMAQVITETSQVLIFVGDLRRKMAFPGV